MSNNQSCDPQFLAKQNLTKDLTLNKPRGYKPVSVQKANQKTN